MLEGKEERGLSKDRYPAVPSRLIKKELAVEVPIARLACTFSYSKTGTVKTPPPMPRRFEKKAIKREVMESRLRERVDVECRELFMVLAR